MRHNNVLPRWLSLSILSALIISGASISVLFYVQESTKNDIKRSLFEDAKMNQIRLTDTIAGKIGSDLDSVMSRLGQLAAWQNLQQGDFTSSDVDKLLARQFKELESHFAIDDMVILNDKNIVVNEAADDRKFIGFDASQRDHIKETIQTKAPVFSNRFVAPDNSSRIAITYPIINIQTGQFLGIVAVSMLSSPFFSSYGNIYDFNSAQYINVLDRNSVFVASPNPAIVGGKFYGDKVQNTFVKNTDAVNALYSKVLSGQKAYAVFDVGFGERLVTGQPVIVNGKPAYFLTVGIPTKLTYDEIDAKLASQNNLNSAQWFLLIVAGGILLLFLIRINNRLNREVSNRTEALVTSNKQLADANEQLAKANKELADANEQLNIHSKMQTEFINIAAHELRTPIQPMMALVDLLKNRFESGEDNVAISTKQVEILDRNAKRLQKLSSEILDATRIEAGTLRLETEILDINKIIRDAIADTASFIPRGKNIDIQFHSAGVAATIDAKFSCDAVTPLLVKADRLRMFEVISNIIRNAIKFSSREGGVIAIITEKREERIDKEGGKVQSVAVVSVKDQGEGITPENRSRLFTKFSSDRERGGTGLGLFLAKNIVEAHGGKIWAENNKDGKGTTFTFTLPLIDSTDPESEMPKLEVKS